MTTDEKMEFLLEQQVKQSQTLGRVTDRLDGVTQKLDRVADQQEINSKVIYNLGVRFDLLGEKVDRLVEDNKQHRKEIGLIWEYLQVQDKHYNNMQALLYKMVQSLSATRRDQSKMVDELVDKDILDRFDDE